MRGDFERLQDVLEAISKIETQVSSAEAFVADELLQVWVVYHLQILGEAVSKVSLDLREQYADVPWKQIIGMRNILVHDYFGIDCDLVWTVVERDLPTLKGQITAILQTLSPA